MRDGHHTRRLTGEQLVELAIVRRLMAATGLDGYAATAAVRDVLEHEGDSPWAHLVGPVIADLLDELSRPFTEMLQRLTPGFEALTKSFNDVLTVLVEQVRPAFEALAKAAHDHDLATRPRRHRRRCPTCRRSRHGTRATQAR